ncbi:MAG: HAMP domain-containing sensor histidine kinase [Sulfurimonas sp.]
MNAETITLLAYGATFGILLISIIYTFVRYIYSKELMYISYSLMQIFSLGYIMAYSHLFSISSTTQEKFLLLAILSAVAFAITFHEGKFIPKINNFKDLIINTLLLNVVILTAFYHYILFEYLPYTVVYAILFLSVVFNLRSGFKPTIVYVIGWSFLCILLFVFELKRLYIQEGYIDIVLSAFAIEAILFTISVSYKYNLFKNKALDHQNMLLQQSKMAKSGEMIANITHQFRQPLNNISYMLINLKNRFESDRMDKDYFETKTKEPFSLLQAMQNSFTVITPKLKNKGIALECLCCDKEDVSLFGKKNELSQVFLALISNASDALVGTTDPKIIIQIEHIDTWIKIIIEDNGCGISNEKIKKIFDPYYTTKTEGSGIGLYLSKMIIETGFNGKIDVESIFQEGTKFTLSIPLHY